MKTNFPAAAIFLTPLVVSLAGCAGLATGSGPAAPANPTSAQFAESTKASEAKERVERLGREFKRLHPAGTAEYINGKTYYGDVSSCMDRWLEAAGQEIVQGANAPQPASQFRLEQLHHALSAFEGYKKATDPPTANLMGISEISLAMWLFNELATIHRNYANAQQERRVALVEQMKGQLRLRLFEEL